METTALSFCRDAIRRHSKSFSLASRLLPAAVRDRAVVVYAWCRRADDAIDLAPKSERPAALARRRRELAEIDAGVAQSDPVLAAFQQVVRETGMPVVYAEALLDGMEMDVRATRYGTLDELLLYCFRVAGTVGLMMCHVMGVRSAAALRNAAHLGIAMQLTNVCRDVEEDLRDGRLYLPAQILDPAAILRPMPERREAVAAAVWRLLGVADGFYRSGDRGLAELSLRCGLAVRAARLVYSAIGATLARRRFDALAGRAIVSTGRKLLLVARAVGWSLLRLPSRLLRPFVPAPISAVVRFPDDVLPV